MAPSAMVARPRLVTHWGNAALPLGQRQVAASHGRVKLHVKLSGGYAVSPSPALLSRSLRTGGSKRLSARTRCAYKSESGEDIPQEIVEAEENSASGRKYRMAAFALFGGLGAALTLTRIALNVTATPVSIDFLQPSLFGELLDIIVIGTAGILWNSELSTKETNIQRIWEEVKRRRAESGPQFVGKDDLRKRKKDKKGGKRRAKGFSQEMREMRVEQRQEAAAKRAEKTVSEKEQKGEAKEQKEAGKTAGGLLGSLKAAYDSANSAGRIQALQVNDALEEAGVLKPLAGKDEVDKDEGSDANKPSN